MRVFYMSDVVDDFIENLTDFLLKYTKKKNSKINDVVSSCLTVFNFYSLRTFSRFKLKDDTTHFKTLNIEELKAIKDYIYHLDMTLSNNLSWSLSILLILDTGVRLSELLDIRFCNVDFVSRSIFLDHTKNGKKRFVFFNFLTYDLLLAASRLNTPFALWNYDKNIPLSRTSIYYFLRTLNQTLKFKINVHPHRLRKTFATELLKQGCPITSISKLLGHSDIKQTMVYLEIDNAMVQQDYERFYPY